MKVLAIKMYNNPISVLVKKLLIRYQQIPTQHLTLYYSISLLKYIFVTLLHS